MVCDSCLTNIVPGSNSYNCDGCNLSWCNECQDSEILTFKAGVMTRKDRYPGGEVPSIQHAIDIHGWVD